MDCIFSSHIGNAGKDCMCRISHEFQVKPIDVDTFLIQVPRVIKNNLTVN